MNKLGSPLASVAAGPDEPRDARRLAREAYHRDDVILIRPGWVADPADRAAVRRIADGLFGERV